MLFTCVLLGLSSAPIYAASEEVDPPSSSEVTPLYPDLDSVKAAQVANDLSEILLGDGTKATTYTTTDIYNLLYAALRGQDYQSSYSLPQMASYLNRISQILGGPGQAVPTAANSISGRLSTISSNISNGLRSINFILNGDDDLSARYVRPDIQTSLFRTDGQANFITVADDLGVIRDFASLIYSSTSQIHADGQNITYQLTQTNSKLDTVNSSISSISSSMSDSYDLLDDIAGYSSTISNRLSTIKNMNWTSAGSVVGLSNTLNGSLISSSGYQTGDLFFKFHVNGYSSSNLPGLLQLFVPVICPWDSTTQNYVSNYAIVNTSGDVITEDIEVITFHNGYYFICYDFYNQTRNDNNDYILRFSVGDVPSYYSYGSGTVRSLPINTFDYHVWAMRHYTKKDSDYLEYLANNLVDPSVQAAREESQEIIDDTLDGFTGDGSAAPSRDDTGSMKGISGSVRSGLDTGASAGDAVSVFSNGDFWGWFSQSNSDQINNAYPAPDVNSMFNTRAPGDYVPDFISGDQDYLSEHLGSDPW